MEKKLQKNISYIFQFTGSARFIASSLSNPVNNLSEGILRIKCKFGYNGENVRLVELNISIAALFLNTRTLKMIVLQQKLSTQI